MKISAPFFAVNFMKIENIEVCKPIMDALTCFTHQGCVVTETRVGDYYIYEVYIKLTGRNGIDLNDGDIENIINKNNNVFFIPTIGLTWMLHKFFYISGEVSRKIGFVQMGTFIRVWR